MVAIAEFGFKTTINAEQARRWTRVATAAAGVLLSAILAMNSCSGRKDSNGGGGIGKPLTPDRFLKDHGGYRGGSGKAPQDNKIVIPLVPWHPPETHGAQQSLTADLLEPPVPPALPLNTPELQH